MRVSRWMMEIERVRGMFPVLRREMNGRQLVYLDSAASSQKPLLVTDGLKEFYEKNYANVHRGIHDLAEEATEKYEESRGKIAQLVHAQYDEIVFTSGTTAGINLVANSLVPTFDEGNIVVTMMEHHSNFVPWQQLAIRHGLELRVIPITPDYRLDMEKARELIDESTRLVAAVHVSNVLGTINPVEELAGIAHANDALLLVDGAQAVPHMRVDVKELDADFYVFSSHKMYGPTGAGALYGRKELLGRMEPCVWGGEMVKDVTIEKTTWNDPPWKFEPGTPGIAQAIGMGFASDFIQDVSYEAIREHEHALLGYMLEALEDVDGLSIIGPRTTEDRAGAVSFVLSGVHPHDVASVLNDYGVAIRAGHHCAQPLHCALGIDATARASLALYNTKADIDRLVDALGKVREVFA